MKTYYDCLPCLIRQAVEAVRMVTDDEAVQEKVIRQVLLETARIDLQKAIDAAKNILFLGDNAGEIVFDKLLIEQMPMDKISYAVKGFPIINDATMEDAIDTGMTGLVKVLDNGCDAPGTILELCSEKFQEVFRQADLVIAKGQGNYETLSGVNDKDIFFLLKVKCPVIAQDLECECGSIVVKRITA
jgi:hypothetical protein